MIVDFANIGYGMGKQYNFINEVFNETIYSEEDRVVTIKRQYKIEDISSLGNEFEDKEDIINEESVDNSVKRTKCNIDSIYYIDNFAGALNNIRKYIGTLGVKGEKCVTEIKVVSIKNNWNTTGFRMKSDYNVRFKEDMHGDHNRLHFIIPATRKKYGVDVDTVDTCRVYDVNISLKFRDDLVSVFNQLQSNMDYFKDSGIWVNKNGVNKADVNIFKIVNKALNESYDYRNVFKRFCLVNAFTDSDRERIKNKVKKLPAEQNLFDANNLYGCHMSDHMIKQVYVTEHELEQLKECRVSDGKWIFNGKLFNTSESLIKKWVDDVCACVGAEPAVIKIK